MSPPRSTSSTVLAPLAALLLAGCLGGGDRRAPARPEPQPPRISSAEARQCLADLGGLGVRFNALDDRSFGGGCSAIASVQLLDIGVPVSNLGAMTCPLGRTFAQWIQNGVRPAAREWLGSELVRVESMGSYACRGVNGASSGRLSEHAYANAVDVAAFVLADGRRITVKGDWRSGDPNVRGFMAAIHNSACRRFKTVLGPDYNAAHHDHFHLDMGRGPFCR